MKQEPLQTPIINKTNTMKKLLFISALCLLVSCNNKEQPPKGYAVIHGKITNPTQDTDFRLYDPISNESTLIEVDQEGNFRDTLRLKKPAYFTSVYNDYFNLYLENNMDLKVDFDAENIPKTITYSGQGAAENNFLKFKNKTTNALLGTDMNSYQEYLGMETNTFETETSAFIKELIDSMESKENLLSSNFIASEKGEIEEFHKSLNIQHEEQLAINAELSPGMPSPEFHDYVNYKGGTNSLSDYKGKYVYIDVWATWCVPCIYEMPFMAEIEKEYEGKNIHFIGVSIDRKKDEAKWREMIVDKELGGVQLLADNEIESQFTQDYYIQGIPRFILLDPKGNIVSYDAPRPSEPRLKELFDSLNI